MNNYTVYKHTFPNGKVYIGITCQKVYKRWGNKYANAPFMKNAIQKYGWENVKHEILFENLTQEEAEQKEIELIAQYKSNQKEFGYNIANGGMHRGKTSEETILKRSASLKGHIMSDDTKMKIKLTKQKNYPNGYHHSKETIEKIQKNRSKVRSIEARKKQSITMKEKYKNGYVNPLKGKKPWNYGLRNNNKNEYMVANAILG